MKCQTIGCERVATIWIVKGGRAKKVCDRCKQEMVATLGWKER